ncbi:BREX-1 system adenine-specific DNA-methyltransferase PglX [Desulfitobacterium hafniense]|uniref:site-specific DNA-methyltransferase (adenine-specific) n=2 Tax=Desulfitobacterium hafniense TaxID=49338 RepID=Q24ZS6_DESHY|nr:BREX-1 system adenine-specific DNA-methyltransferase PglX [Desulfitobacterium hafniense]KTE91820.1 type II deoxyribonuclease [Desulfitobacterium hafniense]BAE82466.1 hypothetical protein DSY0677 [Desulfitobacterium hafniense Y51]
MNKNAIQKYAIWARNELIEQVKQRAYQYGISEEGYGDKYATVIAGRVLTAGERSQRQAFVGEIERYGYKQAVEEVAYTWFNRFVALRYMEVNDYLPTHVRVFSDPSGNFKPEILTNVLHLDLPGLDKTKVSELLNGNATEELYRYLLLTQCNALNALLPEMFEPMGAYTEMLLPNNILKPESVIGRLVKDIPEEDFRDAVQIIGWLYQYYNTEPKQAVFDGLKKNIKITKENIPAATQLFTPDWIVRYMVENSLGRIFIGSRIQGLGISLTEAERIAKEKEIANRFGWKYYIPEAEQTPEVRAQLLPNPYSLIPVEDLKILDPCMGSGHILVYAFDVLMQIYTSEGYSERDAAKLILEKNLYGLEIDRRAFQLAYFALMMKARQYNRRIFTLGVRPQVYEPTGYADGMEYGALVRVDKLEEMQKVTMGQLATDDNADTFAVKLNTWNFRRLLAQKYDVVVTNPPYMGASGMGTKLSDFVKANFPDSKSDASTAFMEQTLYLCKPTGYMAMINIPVWMFLSSYEKLRKKLMLQNTITNMLHFGRGIFGSDFGSTGFVIGRKHIVGYVGSYRRLFEKQGAVDSVEQKEKWFFEGMGKFTATADNFAKVPSSPVAYWVSKNMLRAFETGKLLGSIADSKQGLATADNDRFLRLWFEVATNGVKFDAHNEDEALASGAKWFPYNKGGEFRKWYGNNDYVVNWENNGAEIRDFTDGKGKLRSRPQNTQFYFRECFSWSLVSSGVAAFRYKPSGHIFDVAGMSCFANKELYYLLALCNTKVVMKILEIVAPTINYQCGDIANIPILIADEAVEQINDKVQQNITVSQKDWDAFETSWNFKRHPLVEFRLAGAYAWGDNEPVRRISFAYKAWEMLADGHFQALKANEEELNRIFINIYGLQDELTPEVEDKDVTVRRADLGREIRSLISYAVGCMFGRYSLDEERLILAGQPYGERFAYASVPVAGGGPLYRVQGDCYLRKSDSTLKVCTYAPDKDNIIPVCDDEYFDDDIAGRFVQFIKTVYGADTLEENLKFIADALGGKGTPREVIRNYFLNDFYKDHCKIYRKRPIYWLFDSGKKNGFKALIYMHRYSQDLLAKLRTDYIHEQQERYRTQLAHIAGALNTATGAERARLLKQQDKLSEQARELGVYEEKVHHLADQNIPIDLDDGVKKNYEIFADVLAKI